MANDWTQREVDITIGAYFRLFKDDIAGRPINKNQIYKATALELGTREWKAVSRKFQNISAVLVDLGLDYLKGLQPNANYQKLLFERVVDYLADQQLSDISRDAEPPRDIEKLPTDWDSVITPPPRPFDRPKWQIQERPPIRIDFQAKQIANRQLGEAGERFVVELEKYRLAQRGQADLVRDVEWTAKVRGDGLGYDVRSFDGRGEEHFIEVKTTNAGIYKRFVITENEVAKAEQTPEQFSLYRVYDFMNSPHIYTVAGNLRKELELEPRNYWGFVRRSV